MEHGWGVGVRGVGSGAVKGASDNLRRIATWQHILAETHKGGSYGLISSPC